MTELEDLRVRNYRAWCAARVGSLSGAEIGVALCDFWLNRGCKVSDQQPAPEGMSDERLAYLRDLYPWGEPGVPDGCLTNEGRVIRELLAHIDALQQRRSGQEWRTIESAPRDGRRILVGYFNFEGEWKAREAWWRIPYEGAPKKAGWWCHDKDGTLLSADVHFSPEGKPLGATHWQPLPPAPAAEKADITPTLNPP